MSFINHSLRTIHCKIVYFGAGLSGKTTNLQNIYQHTQGQQGVQAASTSAAPTLFFDFLPLSLGDIRGFKTRFHLYTVPGQIFYDAARKLILRGADGVVFVADSQLTRMDANLMAWENLRQSLVEVGFAPDRMPTVVQANKRDLTDVVPPEGLRSALGLAERLSLHQAVATRGEGVFDTLKAIARQVLAELKEEG